MTIAETRATLAALISDNTGLTCQPYPPSSSASRKAMDAWVVLGRMTPETFRSSAVTFSVVALLGADEAAAERKLDDEGPALLAAVAPFPAGDVSLEPTAVQTDSGAVFYGAVLTLTMEV